MAYPSFQDKRTQEFFDTTLERYADQALSGHVLAETLEDLLQILHPDHDQHDREVVDVDEIRDLIRELRTPC